MILFSLASLRGRRWPPTRIGGEDARPDEGQTLAPYAWRVGQRKW
jgi:hypothetical protein